MRDYDAQPILVASRYTYEQQRAFMRYRMRFLRRAIHLSWLAVLPLSAYELATGLEKWYVTLLYLAGWGLLTLAANGALYTRAIYEAGNDEYCSGVTYQIKNQYATVKKILAGEVNVFYELLYKVVETDRMFYLFATPFQYEMLEKAGFENGQPDELRALLKSRMKPGRRYVTPKQGGRPYGI